MITLVKGTKYAVRRQKEILLRCIVRIVLGCFESRNQTEIFAKR